MVILDRVCCNFCHTYIGQVWSRPAESTDGLECLTVAPHFTVCPDCCEVADINHRVTRSPVLLERK